jgi:CubicO group peptidase (beta-lactamase class C family)
MLQHFERNWLFSDEPGTQYRYSIYDWIWMSAAIEAAAHQPFLKFMQERTFDPLRMSDTIPNSARIEAGEDFPLVNMVRELIYDPEAARDSARASTKKPIQNRVTSYFPRFHIGS